MIASRGHRATGRSRAGRARSTRRSWAARGMFEPVLPLAAEPVDEHHRLARTGPDVDVVDRLAVDLDLVQVRRPVDRAPVGQGGGAVAVVGAAALPDARRSCVGNEILGHRALVKARGENRAGHRLDPVSLLGPAPARGARALRRGAALRGAVRLGHHACSSATRSCTASRRRTPTRTSLAGVPYPDAVETVRAWHEAGPLDPRDEPPARRARTRPPRGWLDRIGMPYDDLHCSFDKVTALRASWVSTCWWTTAR